MSPNYHKRLMERRKRRSALGVAARGRKRLSESSALIHVGAIVTSGCLGAHRVDLLARDCDEPWIQPLFDIVKDGK